MKEIVVISGKGGTGKTSLTASFSMLGGEKIITADCDVDAADMHLLLEPDFALSKDFYSGKLAEIDAHQCVSCGNCKEVCRFDAIEQETGYFSVVDLNCEGCGYCAHICPANAIQMRDNLVGEWYDSAIKSGGRMIHAKLGVGAENSGKLVAKVKEMAKAKGEQLGKDIVLVDGSPGIGCPVVSSLSGANLVVMIAEPSVSGIHDIKRVIELVKKFKIPACAIINKADINPKQSGDLVAFFEEQGIAHIGDIIYNENFTQAMTEGRTIVEFNDKQLASVVNSHWQKILELLQNER